MKIRPLQDRVVVRRMEEETTSAGGIVLPGSATEKPAQGEVLAVGPGKRLDSGDTQPVDVNVGDTVVFGKYSSNTVKVDDEELLILNEKAIEAALKLETELGYFVLSGRYWKVSNLIERKQMQKLDELWISAVPGALTKHL